MSYQLHDLVGNAGVILILAAYYLLQVGRLRSSSPAYSLLNTAGAGLVLVSLAVAFNASAFALEAAWLLISLYGLAKSLRKPTRDNG